MSGIALSGTPAPTGQATPAPTTQTTAPTTTAPTTTPPPSTTPPAGSTGSPAPTTPPTSEQTPPWYSTLQDAELKSLAEKKGWKTVEDGVKSYAELERAFSAKQAANAAPADPKAYTFDVPTDLPSGVSYNDQFAEAFRGMAHKAGLSTEQAKALHGAYVEFAKSSYADQSQQQTAQLTERITKAAVELEAALGAKPGTPAFNRSVELAKRAIRMTDPGLMDTLKSVGAIVTVQGQDMVADAKLFSAFAKMGQSMYSEDTLYGEPAKDVNPFAAETENMAGQAHLIKNDPERAKLLIRAAGPKMTAMYKSFLER